MFCLKPQNCSQRPSLRILPRISIRNQVRYPLRTAPIFLRKNRSGFQPEIPLEIHSELSSGLHQISSYLRNSIRNLFRDPLRTAPIFLVKNRSGFQPEICSETVFRTVFRNLLRNFQRTAAKYCLERYPRDPPSTPYAGSF